MFKKFAVILVFLMLFLSAVALAAPTRGQLAPARPGGAALVVNAPSQTGMGARNGSLVLPAATQKFYYNPITFVWEVVAGDAKYKLKSVGSKGGVVKANVPVGDCTTECQVEVQFPKTAQSWTTKAKVFDAADVKIAIIKFDAFNTVPPAKPAQTSPANGGTVSGSSVSLVFDYAEGATKFTVKVIDPFGDTVSGAADVEDICNQDLECGFEYSTTDGSNLPSGTYTWKVAGKGAYGKGKSATRTFVIP